MYLKLFESVKITKGFSRSIIFDTNSGFLKFIPNILYDLLVNDNQNYLLLKKSLDDESNKILQQYIDFLISNKLAIIISSKKDLNRFKNSNNKIDEPNSLNYLIIDLDNINILCERIIPQIIESKIRFIQIRTTPLFSNTEILELFSLLRLFNETYINEISIVIKYTPEIFSFIINGNIDSEKYLQFIMHSSDENLRKDYGSIEIIKNKETIKIPISCGSVKLENMNSSRSFYYESIHCNSCLNKKISIDTNGNIRNCPSMSQNFGNIKDTTLEGALEHPDFKKYWNLTKDHIEVCRDCEFRYMCTDCRAYTERTHTNSEGLDTSKPLKCGYNPYTSEWEEWSKSPLKEKGIKHYDME
ncbi:grasp-with-spasm system SPASM domain peptide maturase [Chryseobacterium paridis]|uniref:Grasp-with-spasm system SPASM domain peptide maturase n=1 Tax=Chryseobacterium paridis TaxID=2800328 RepID=A0ABS1FQY5_9FLAO|nr:grasp-with-spasm system SPASM domain peptide maturase [Chryseobacterium paridis]MBK1894830.1 grasp-with-spasm system SPASM domain peptide maturase [Chryseobacterium paridis]